MTEPAAAIAASCARHGLDLAATARVGDYDAAVAPPHRMNPDGDPNAAVLVIGNTRRLWSAFASALRAEPALVERDHPLDSYVEAVVRNAIAPVTDASVRWAHRAEPAHLSFQILAEKAGLAWRSPARISVHPQYGPWIALRAAVLVPGTSLQARPDATRPCLHCATGCEKRLATLDPATAGWRDWLAVRDACPLGREFRYAPAQIEYHYTKSRGLLRALARSG